MRLVTTGLLHCIAILAWFCLRRRQCYTMAMQCGEVSWRREYSFFLPAANEWGYRIDEFMSLKLQYIRKVFFLTWFELCAQHVINI